MQYAAGEGQRDGGENLLTQRSSGGVEWPEKQRRLGLAGGRLLVAGGGSGKFTKGLLLFNAYEGLINKNMLFLHIFIKVFHADLSKSLIEEWHKNFDLC